MKDVIANIAEAKIKEAINNGQLKDLPGKGEPLEIEDLSHIPEDLRASYKILKNSGFRPPELELKNEIITMQKLLETCCEDEYDSINNKLRQLRIKYNLMLEKGKGKRYFKF